MSPPRSSLPTESPFVRPNVRRAVAADLDAINRVVAAAMTTWNVGERVRRLSLPLYRYGSEDIEFLDLLVAERDGVIVGVAALEPLADAGALLHGIYVSPEQHCRGIGSRLLRCAEALARRRGFDELRVRARPESIAFFTAQDYRQLPRDDDREAYPWLMSKPLAAEREARV